MRKNIYTFLAVAFAAGLLAGCGSKDSGKDTTIVVGASPAPHAEILEAAKPVLEKAGCKSQTCITPFMLFHFRIRGLSGIIESVVPCSRSRPA